MHDPEPESAESTITPPGSPGTLAIALNAAMTALTPQRRSLLSKVLTVAWIIFLIGASIWLIRNQRDELGQIWDMLKTADSTWLAAAVIAEIAANLTVAATYSVTFRRLGHKSSIWYQSIVHLERAGVAFAAPLGGAVTAWVYMDRMRRRHIPSEDALLALGIRTASVYFASGIILIIAAFMTGRPLFIAAAIAAIVAIGALTIFGRGTGSSEWKTFQRWARKLPQQQSDRALEGINRLKAHDLRPADLINSVLTTLLTRAATIALIYICVAAVDERPSWLAVFMAYVASFVAARAVPIMYGMGAVETSMSVALTRYGVPGDAAVGATLLFRFFDFFAPSVIGLILYTIDEHRVPKAQRGPSQQLDETLAD